MISLLLAAACVQVNTVPYDWRNIEIVGGGFVTGVIPHPAERDLVYCRTDIGGAYRWNPKTNRWIPLQDWITRPDWNLYGVESVGIDPSAPNRLYMAVGTYTNEWGGKGAILRSKDRGDTWERTDLPFKNGGNEDGRSIGERLAVDPSNSKVVYFGTRHNGLLRSEDYGATWKQMEGFPVKGRTNRIGIGWVMFWQNRTFVNATSSQAPLIESDDGGKTWKPIPGQPTGLMPHHAKIASDGTMVVAYSNGPGPNGVTDGAVWKLQLSTGQWMEITPEKPGPGNTFGYAGVAVDPRNPAVLMVSSLDRWTKHDTIWRSLDGGKSWASISENTVRDSSVAPYLNWARPEPEFGHWIGDVEIDPHNPDRAWYVTGATIWMTSDLRRVDRKEKSNWIPAAEGLEETAVIDLVSPPEGAHTISALGDIAGFAHFDMSRSPKPGMWTNPIWNTTTDVDFAGLLPSRVIRVGYGNGPHGAISDDGGMTWKPFAQAPGAGPAGTAAISADGSRIVWIPDRGSALLSVDSGQTWTPAKGAPEGGRVVSDKHDPMRFTIHVGRTGKVFSSRDGGASFQAASDVLPHEDAGKLQAVLGHAGHLWLPLKEKGLFRSLDGGRNFEKVNSLSWAEQIGFGKAAPGASYPAIYAIGRLDGVPGVYRSTDEAKSWVRINDSKTGFGTMQVIEGDPKVFGRVYVGTNGRGVLVADPKASG